MPILRPGAFSIAFEVIPPPAIATLPIRSSATSHANIRFLTVNHKGHNPNYTVDAVNYKDAFFADLTAKRKKNLLPSDEEKALYAEGFDWHRMTAQDEKVWAEIFKTLDA